MLVYLGKRMLMALSVLLTVVVATFLLFFMGPSDPAQALCPDTKCNDAKLSEIRHALKLDRPVSDQLSEYLRGMVAGRQIEYGGTSLDCKAPCLGYSFRSRVEVKEAVLSKFPSTAMLALMTMVMFLVTGVTIGVYAARRRGTRLDRLVVGVSQVVGSIPSYILLLLFALYLTVLYPIFPRATGINDGAGPWLAGLIAPAVILGLIYSTSYVRFTRASMIDTLAQDYVRTARSKGIGEQRVVYKHAFRAAMSPVVTILGLDMAGLLSGTLITERIFEVDGMGRLAITSLGLDDLPMIMGTVLVGCFLVVLMNLLVDIAYSFIDPRVRLS